MTLAQMFLKHVNIWGVSATLSQFSSFIITLSLSFIPWHSCSQFYVLVSSGWLIIEDEGRLWGQVWPAVIERERSSRPPVRRPSVVDCASACHSQIDYIKTAPEAQMWDQVKVNPHTPSIEFRLAAHWPQLQVSSRGNVDGRDVHGSVAEQTFFSPLKRPLEQPPCEATALTGVSSPVRPEKL